MIRPEWVQVAVDAVAATATSLAVVVALWLPRRDRRRAALASGRAALELSNFAIDLRRKLETELFTVSPAEELAQVRMLMKIADRIILRDSTPASMIAVYTHQQPIMQQIEGLLVEWVSHVDARKSYDALPARKQLKDLMDRLVDLSPVKKFANL